MSQEPFLLGYLLKLESKYGQCRLSMCLPLSYCKNNIHFRETTTYTTLMSCLLGLDLGLNIKVVSVTIMPKSAACMKL